MALHYFGIALAICVQVLPFENIVKFGSTIPNISCIAFCAYFYPMSSVLAILHAKFFRYS